MRDRSAYLLLLGMAVCFGGTWPAGKLAVEEVGPFTVAAVRFTIASVLLALWAGTRHGPIRAPGWSNLPLVLAMGATAVAGYNIFFLYGLELAPASDGAVIVPGFDVCADEVCASAGSQLSSNVAKRLTE